VPDNISRQVLGYLTQFAGKASRLGSVGLALTLFTALALILTIDRTLNGIWRVKRPRPLAQRVLIYWAALTLGPVVLGMSLAATSVAVSASRGLFGTLPGSVRFLFDTIEFFLLAGGMTLLYRYVPNTSVKWSHAWSGGLFVAIGIEVGKRLLAFYIGKIPTYSMVYGAFATVPILLIWIYVAWVIVLLGAVIAAYLPSMRSGVARRAGVNGWPFQLALEALQQLHLERSQPAHGLTGAQLAQRMGVSPLQLEPVLEALLSLDWVGRLASDEEQAPADPRTGTVTVHQEPRFVLLASPDNTPLAPLMQRLLLDRVPATEVLWQDGRWAALRLADVVQPGMVDFSGRA
jgi:membrane protein